MPKRLVKKVLAITKTKRTATKKPARKSEPSGRFCEYQVKCAEDTDGTWTCSAHMAEGRAMGCIFLSLKAAKSAPYPCVDAKPPQHGDN